jgi:hypothetical protein
MAERDDVNAEITDSDVLDAAEVSITPDQSKAIAEGCIARALLNLNSDQKTGLKSAVRDVEADLATAIDKIRNRRSRMSLQRDNLNARKKLIQVGAERISALYTYAEPAINACQAAAEAARLAKEGSDLVHARLNEVEYQLALISATDLALASEERDLSSAMDALDEMVISLR